MDIKEANDQDYNELREDYVKRMEDMGYKIIVPTMNQLTIDIDTGAQLEQFYIMIARLQKEHAGVTFKIIDSETEGHKHIYVKLPFDLQSHVERIALQSILGSDPMREILSYFRWQHGDQIPTLLREKNNVAN